MVLTAWKIHTKFSQLIARWLNNFGIILLKDQERKCMCVLTVRPILGFLRLRQFPRCLSKPETHPGATAFRSRCLWIYSRGCKFCNSPSGRSGVPARITRAGGRPTDSGDAKVGTAGNIGILESAGGNENCVAQVWRSGEKNGRGGGKCSKVLKRKLFDVFKQIRPMYFHIIRAFDNFTK